MNDGFYRHAMLLSVYYLLYSEKGIQTYIYIPLNGEEERTIGSLTLSVCLLFLFLFAFLFYFILFLCCICLVLRFAFCLLPY